MQNLNATTPNSTYPIIIKPSLKALYGKFFKSFGFAVVLILALLFTPSSVKVFIGLYLLIHIPVMFISILTSYLRIKNTVYTIDSGLIRETSYTLKWLGVKTHSANLTQLRQISAFSNSKLDVFFFKCGFVRLTVSGDISDFTIADILKPQITKSMIESICFPKVS